VRTELHFAMDAQSSALDRVGSYLMPTLGRYDVRWMEDDGEAFLALTVPEKDIESMKRRICRLHPSVRFLSANRVDS
jgi:hypothetical protein